MKKLILITAFVLFSSLGIFAQCTGDAVCVSQDTINRAAAAVDELKAARDVIAKFQTERSANEAERAAAQVLIKGLNQLLDTKDKIIAEYERIQVLYKQVIEFQQKIIENLEKQLAKPKSAFQKLMSALKTIATIVFGIGIGRSFIK